jgi:phage terminase Nu1 subunit (DNA packaging protein)
VAKIGVLLALFMADDLIVNRDQLSQLLRCSLPTVNALVKRYSDFPIIERGGLGREWKFDGNAVIAFLQSKRNEEDQAQQRRSELLAQCTLPLPGVERVESDLDIDDQIKAARLRALQREEAKTNGFLVPTLEVRVSLERAFRRLGQSLDQMAERIAKRHNLPEAVKREMAREIDDMRTAFVRDAGTMLTSDHQSTDQNDDLLSITG